MESSEFSTYLTKFPSILKLFKGVYSFDKIPSRIKINHFLICNTDKSSGSGKHWFCFYRVNRNLIECFDSLGINDEKKSNLIHACNFSHEVNLTFNNTQIQSSLTDTCGKFCLMFIVERLHNPDLSFDELLNTIFSEEVLENEKVLEAFFSEIFGN